MYPTKELARLEMQKKLLIARSTLLRTRCRLAAHSAAKPLAWFDTARLLWKKAAPVVSLSSLIFSRLQAVRSVGLVSQAMKWAPVALRLWRHLKRAPTPVVATPRASLAKESPPIAVSG